MTRIAVFQFQYGTIEVMLLKNIAKEGHLFQFQYGTIEVVLGVGSGSRRRIFQFQYGTIEVALNALGELEQKHFNSNMVRLRLR